MRSRMMAFWLSCILSSVCAPAVPALAATIDFAGLPGPLGSNFTGFTESGFTVTPTSSDWRQGLSTGELTGINFSSPMTTTSVSVTNGGNPFSFSSIDLFANAQPIPYTITGQLGGNSVFTNSGTMPLIYGFTLQPLSNPSASSLIDTLIVQLTNPIGPYPAFSETGLTNIVVAPSGSAIGDPHLTTYGGVKYDFEGVGEFLLAQSKVPGDQFSVDVRTEFVGQNVAGTYITATAATLCGENVTFDVDRPQEGGSLIWIGSQQLSLTASNLTVTFGGCTISEISANLYQLAWDTGETLTITDQGLYLDVSSTLSWIDSPDLMAGLLSTDQNPYFWSLADGPSLFSADNSPIPTPEPAGVATFGAGLAGLALLRLMLSRGYR